MTIIRPFASFVPTTTGPPSTSSTGTTSANGGAIFTRRRRRRPDLRPRLKVAIFGMDLPTPCAWPFKSFGGFKPSLFFDHHLHGPERVRFHTRLETITSR